MKNVSKTPESTKVSVRSESNRRRLEKDLREMLENSRAFPEFFVAQPTAQLPYRRVIE